MSAARPGQQTRRVLVSRRIDEAVGVVTLELTAVDGNLPRWNAGAHIDVLLPSGLLRQYSLLGDPEENAHWRIAILLEPRGRGGSREIHGLVEGSEIEVRGPRNNFPLEPAQEYLFIAGGIGITPISAMIHEAERASIPWSLLYGGRERASMAMSGALLRAYPDRVRLRPQDEYGLLDFPEYLGARRPGTLVYACGPEPMLRAVEDLVNEWDPGVLRLERFAPIAPNPNDEDTAFEVEISSTGEVYQIPPQRSIYAVLEDAGVDVFAACQEGTCRSCVTRVLEGIPLHRDSALSPSERAANDIMTICVSRSLTPRLVLDI